MFELFIYTCLNKIISGFFRFTPRAQTLSRRSFSVFIGSRRNPSCLCILYITFVAFGCETKKFQIWLYSTLKHIQVVSTASPQTQTGVTPKSIIISGQPAQLIQTTALQHAVQSQPQTVTFAIRAATQTNPQTSPQTQQQQQQQVSYNYYWFQILDSLFSWNNFTILDNWFANHYNCRRFCLYFNINLTKRRAN